MYYVTRVITCLEYTWKCETESFIAITECQRSVCLGKILSGKLFIVNFTFWDYAELLLALMLSRLSALRSAKSEKSWNYLSNEAAMTSLLAAETAEKIYAEC